MSPSASRPSAPLPSRLIRKLELSSGEYSVQAIAAMHETLPFFEELGADVRASVALVVQTGVTNFVRWLRDPDSAVQLTTQAFGAVPPELMKQVSLRQTVDMVRTATGVFERYLPALAYDDEQRVALTEAVLRYSREIAFSAATVYASAAESRGAWDARLEALVVDGVVRGDADESLLSRASALGWDLGSLATVLVGNPPDDEGLALVGAVHAAAAEHGRNALVGVQGSRLVVIVSGRLQPALLDDLAACFAAGPVVVGPTSSSVGAAHRSALEAMAGLRAVPAWPAAPRPVLAADLLPERVLAGDPYAERALLQGVVHPLDEAGGSLASTLQAYLEGGGAIESCARSLFVHANTVRYRLRKVAEITHREPSVPRDAYVLRVALAVGRLTESRPSA
ncbi:helix-turn-helix domain-containing protein [Rhodococcus sp. X156]|uniref:PucR family transcriptional regulator n=1 Tax=Rhodococcus sp. X156 TaxID=2499145 RepID=UPI0019D30790|nr:helix-turn-helix domain-containing protein [Rhodococcus sp. X156]